MTHSIMKYTRYTIGIFAGLVLFFGGSSVASAQMVVDFQPDVLFGVSSFLPGDTETAVAVVENQYGESKNVYTEAVNVHDPDDLGDQMTLRILADGSEIYKDSFGTFLITGKAPLSTLASGETETYTYEVTFNEGTGDAYQGKSLGFDLCVGFEGGNLQCGDTVISDPEDPGGGGGGSSGSKRLRIFNERVTNIQVSQPFIQPGAATGTVVIEWETNLKATSQVIYGLVAVAPYNLDLDTLPYYGYPLGTTEDPTKKTEHLVELTDLLVGQTYVFRVVSRASPATVSDEHEFIITLADDPTITPTPDTGSPISVPGIVAGDQEINIDEEEPPAEEQLPPPQVAGVFSDVAEALEEESACYLSVLLILLAIYLAWLVWDKIRDYKNILTRYERNVRRLQFLSAGVAAALGVVIILGYICAIIPLLIALAILVALLLVVVIRGDREDRTPESTLFS